MGTYEVLCILPVSIAEDDRTSLITDFRGIAEQAGAKTITEDTWGRRRLAYPINKQPEGVYHLYVFEAEPGSLDDLDRRMRNSDKIMRHLIVRTDLETRRARKKGLLLEEKKAASAARRPKPVTMTDAPETESPIQKTELSAKEAVEEKKQSSPEAPINAEAKPVEPEASTDEASDAGSEEE